MFCDNMAVVEILNTGKIRVDFLATCASNVWLITIIFNIGIILVHVDGKSNTMADLLFIWVITSNPECKLRQ